MQYSKINIVLIEDDLILGDLIYEILTLNNFNVKWFKNGRETIKYLKSHIPDIIISDLMMPRMSGEELFLEIRKNKKFNTTPFIIISANTNDEIKIAQLENGVNDFILKPFKTKELIFKIKNIIYLKQNIQNKFIPDPFSKVTIVLSQKDFITSLNENLISKIKSKVDIDILSKELCISKSTLDKKIRKLTTKNISQYIREFKLEYAIKLINLGETSIQFLVNETGFNSFSYFSTSFKTYTKLSPRDYISLIKKEVKVIKK